VAGYNSGTMQNCYTTVTITANGRGMIPSGVVGLMNTTPDITLKNCVALNPGIYGNSGFGKARVTSSLGIGQCIVSNNYARSDMLIDGNTITSSNANGKDGADVAAGTYKTQAFWQSTLGWDFTNVWQLNANNLPILRGVGGTQNHNVQ